MKTGRVSENVYKRSILQQIRTKRKEVLIGAGLGEDCAIFSFAANAGTNKNDERVMVSCMRESVVETIAQINGDSCKIAAGPEAVPVRYLLTDCVNALAACNAEAEAAALSVLLPSEAEEEILKAVVADAEAVCAEQNIQLVQARGRVTAAATEPFATVTVYGPAGGGNDLTKNTQAECHTVKAARPGHDIVVSKWIGLGGTAILARRHRESILSRYPAWLVDEAAAFDRYLPAVPEAAAAIKSGVCAMHLISEGGILAALWELAEGAGVGLTIDLKKLPIRQETVEICNHCKINPYELWSGGSFLMTGTDGPGLVAALEAAGIPAVMAGKITDSNDRLIINEDEVRYLDRPHADSIYEKGEQK